jgi:hypothetical protein
MSDKRVRIEDPDLIAACDLALETGEIVRMVDEGLCVVPDLMMVQYQAQGYPYVETAKITRHDGRELYIYNDPESKV